MPYFIGVSTHAPLWGATGLRRAGGRQRACFNPRAPMGRDCARAVCHVGLFIVSTHAPLWGATPLLTAIQSSHEVSTHAPLWGATRRAYLCSQQRTFQPTRPYGARPFVFEHRPFERWFQSTRPCGARPSSSDASRTMSSFQSTRPYGARLVVYAGWCIFHS